jgi:hypothetical protein
MANALLVAALLACVSLLLRPTEFFPPCPIHRLFGLECPGCGATRALVALLHGRWIQALRLNALFVLLLPCAFAFAAESYRRAVRAEDFRWPQLPAPALYATLAATAIFTVARNLQ